MRASAGDETGKNQYILSMHCRRLPLLFSMLISVLLLTACGGGGGAGRFTSSGASGAGSSGNRMQTACSTLSKYAFNGIPATYIDDGADLLYILAGEFSLAGRNDIASTIENIVDLTYQGPYGQLTAKSELVNLANAYC